MVSYLSEGSHYMLEHSQLLKSLFIELSENGCGENPQAYLDGANENLRELHKVISKQKSSHYQRALSAEAGYWLYQIKELTEGVING